MKNFEKCKTVEECCKAHRDWCYAHTGPNGVCNNPHEDVRGNCIKCAMKWMLLDEDEADKPMRCPFCGSSTEVVIDECGCYAISCIHCEYGSPAYNEDKYAIEAHNRICRAVAAYKESEVK